MRGILLVVPLVLAACGDGAGGDGGMRNDAAAAASEEAKPASAAEPPEREGGPGGENRAAAAPPSADGMHWNFSRTATGPKLAFGEPATDNVKLMLRCVGSGTVRISSLRPGRPDGRSDTVTVDADRVTHRAAARAQDSALGGVMLEADLPVSAAPLERMQAGEGLTVHWGDQTIRTPAAGERQDQVRAFFEACGGA